MRSPRSRTSVAIALAACAAVAAGAAQAQNEAARTEEARAIAASLATGLGSKLQEAIKSGGPAAAIGVCTSVAPTMTGAMSRQRGIKVTRVSLKVRNPLLGTPDAWEQGVLATFEARLARGEAPDKLEFAEVVSEPAGKYFRYMKALPAQPLCLNCHGDPAGFSPEVREALARDYPADRATGYAVGQLRGAISIKQPQ